MHSHFEISTALDFDPQLETCLERSAVKTCEHIIYISLYIYTYFVSSCNRIFFVCWYDLWKFYDLRICLSCFENESCFMDWLDLWDYDWTELKLNRENDCIMMLKCCITCSLGWVRHLLQQQQCCRHRFVMCALQLVPSRHLQSFKWQHAWAESKLLVNLHCPAKICMIAWLCAPVCVCVWLLFVCVCMCLCVWILVLFCTLGTMLVNLHGRDLYM